MSRPSRVSTDVWNLMREYAEDGGLLDIGEDVAILTDLEVTLRDSELPVGEMVEARRKVATSRIAAKKAYLDVQKEKNLVITHDRFMALMNDIGAILMQHLSHDETALRNVARAISNLVRRLREQQA